jgi:hypothetical protein
MEKAKLKDRILGTFSVLLEEKIRRQLRTQIQLKT